MVMPARVADARVANVLCGERAAGMQPSLRVAPQTKLRFEFLVRAFHPGMKKKTARPSKPLRSNHGIQNSSL